MKPIPAILSSTLFRLTMIVAFCVSFVSLSLAVLSYVAARHTIMNHAQANASHVTELIAGQISDALAEDRTAEISIILQNLQKASGASLELAAAFNADGNVMATTGPSQERLAEIIASVDARMHNGLPVSSNDGMTVAVPMQSGKLVAVWSADQQLAVLFRNAVLSFLIAGLPFFVSLGLAFYLIRVSVSQPLNCVRNAMERIADGAFDAPIPNLKHSDEIGAIAHSLDAFRTKLCAGEADQIEALFKGSAFNNSSVPMVLISDKMRIASMNTAFRAMLGDHQDTISKIIANFDDAHNLIGMPLAKFKPLEDIIRSIEQDPGQLPMSIDIKLGYNWTHINFSAISDTDGDFVGCVSEWTDVTEQRLQASILEAIDTSQVRLEFDCSGSLLFANYTCRNALPTATRAQTNWLTCIDFEEAKSGSEIWTSAKQKGGLADRFTIKHEAESECIIQGTLNTLTNKDGSIDRYILIGTNITKERQSATQTSAQQLILEAEQTQVVDGLRRGLEALQNNDLSNQITTHFADRFENLRKDYNSAITGLNLALATALSNAETFCLETGSINGAMEDLARRTERQAATLEETAAAVDQMASSLRSSSQNAQAARDMAADARNNAQQSSEVVAQTIKAMSEIEASSAKIAKITGLIEDIAFQTNLLALNAGVEAARAGDAGRGFAVVASEVRDLAQRSSIAASDITNLITTSTDHVQNGVKLVGKTGQVLDEILKTVTNVSTRMVDIAQANADQANGLEQINSAVNDLDQVTQNNAAMFEETSASSANLSAEAQRLLETIGIFKLAATHRPERPVGSKQRSLEQDYANAS